VWFKIKMRFLCPAGTLRLLDQNKNTDLINGHKAEHKTQENNVPWQVMESEITPFLQFGRATMQIDASQA
jgi:hypothetical protein